MPGSFRFVPACGCCDAACNLLMGPFCDCCGLLASGSLRIWDGSGFDKAFPITYGYASITVPKTGTYHSQIVAPYTARTLNDFTVTRTYDAPSSKWICSFTPSVKGFAPPDQPATVTVTTPNGTAVTLNHCGSGTAVCDADQFAWYQGSTTVTVTHGCWCSTAATIDLPVVFRWRFAYLGLPCGLDVWVPMCRAPSFGFGAGMNAMLCGFTVTAPASCVDPASVVIPTPTGTDPLHPPTPCLWVKLGNFDLTIYSQPTTCSPLYWRSGAIPAWTRTTPQCVAPSASSYVWTGGGYLTVTA